MGYRIKAKCRECGQSFHVDHGGGFVFHLVRCDKCGRTKHLPFDKLGELHMRYLKGLDVPYSMATEKADATARELPSDPPISKDEYNAGVEAAAGHCRCRGKYRMEAPPRCPKCRSTNIEEGMLTVMYD